MTFRLKNGLEIKNMRRLFGALALSSVMQAASLVSALAEPNTMVCRSEESSWCTAEKAGFQWTVREVPSLTDTSSVATCIRYCGKPDGPLCDIQQTKNEDGGEHGHNLFTVRCH